MGGNHRLADTFAAALAALAVGLTLAKIALVMTILAATTSFIIGCIRIGRWARGGDIGE